jgi:hypothetical protein
VSRLEVGKIDDMARVADHILITVSGDLRSIDVSDPRLPRVDGEYPNSGAYQVAALPGGIVALGTATYGVARSAGLRVLQGAFIP